MSVRRSPENSSRLAIESVQCSICNDTNAEIDFVETPCQHRFHRTCVTSWLLQNETCPNCRQPCLSSQLNDSTRRAQDTTLEVPRVQNGSNPNSRTGAVPRSRPNTRPTTRSTATISNNRPSTSSQPQRSPRAGGSQRTTSISEGRIQELITNALEAYQTQLSSTLSEQISLAMQNLHIPTSQRQSLEWDVELPPALRSYIRSDQRLWDLYIGKINSALRNNIHQSIGESPYYVIFGQHMLTHGKDYKLLRNIHMLSEGSAKVPRADEFPKIRADIAKRLIKAYEKNRNNYDLRARPRTFEVGQEVIKRNFVLSNQAMHVNAKLAPVGIKARIKEKRGQSLYLLEDYYGKELGVFHAKDIW
ncbi:uncharacterized protein LOC26513927 [Drosophila ananassae]|uniref:uncharacterized protein LOC26513927 n=1 Tax=Drosophila ananassae TaxID=7217 RepID=UPI0013A5BEFA|nr:uncharacterized protein LOC26513927 [Drosophila ananassae]XP_032310854.1 uncharacterized protein LOC26513927 [Drosophila ananassae]